MLNSLHPHTKNWLEAHVQGQDGNLICLYDDNGVTAHELQQELVTYYSDNLNSRGKRISSEAALRLIRGDDSSPGVMATVGGVTVTTMTKS